MRQAQRRFRGTCSGFFFVRLSKQGILIMIRIQSGVDTSRIRTMHACVVFGGGSRGVPPPRYPLTIFQVSFNRCPSTVLRTVWKRKHVSIFVSPQRRKGNIPLSKSRSSTVSIVSKYGLDCRGHYSRECIHANGVNECSIRPWLSSDMWADKQNAPSCCRKDTWMKRKSVKHSPVNGEKWMVATQVPVVSRVWICSQYGSSSL